MMKKGIIFLMTLLIGLDSNSQESEITPAHVYQLVKNTHKVLDLIREHQKVEKYEPVEFAIERANPREVFYQAVGLLEKTNNLCFLYTRQIVEVPASQKEDLVPADVYATVNLTYKQLIHLKEYLNINEEIVPEEFSELKTPNDVFKAIIQIGRQISVFDGNNITPSDVYLRVSASFNYANSIYFDFEDVRIIPEPALIEGKLPVDVYKALLEVIELERKICNKIDRPFALINESARPSIKPSDVSDLAGVVLSEMKFFVDQVSKNGEGIQAPIFKENRTPSHVYQRVKHLELYLKEILLLMDQQVHVIKINTNE